MSRRVLIIAHLYHASPRIPGLSRYLSGHGWEPVILTPPLDSWGASLGEPAKDLAHHVRLVETARYDTTEDAAGRVATSVRARVVPGTVLWRLLQQGYHVVSAIYRIFHLRYLELKWYPDKEKEWIPCILASARKLLNTEHYDVLISTSSPVSAHIAASKISAEYGVPWVADLRDLWTQNHNYPFSPIRKYFERCLERRTLNRARSLVTISEEWVTQLAALHEEVPGYSIKNGFDPSVYRCRVDLTRRFTITYTGQLYAAQNPGLLFSALRELVAEGVLNRRRVLVRFFGPKSPVLMRYAAHPDLRDMVELHGIVPWETVARHQMESQLLLLLNWGTKRGAGWYPLKLFEYLGAHRPVIAVGGRGGDVVDGLLARTHAGVYCASQNEVKAAVSVFYQQYEAAGDVPYHGIESEIVRFSYPKLAKDYARVLSGVVEHASR